MSLFIKLNQFNNIKITDILSRVFFVLLISKHINNTGRLMGLGLVNGFGLMGMNFK